MWMNVDELRVFMGCSALCCNITFIMRSDWYIDGVFWCIKGIVMHLEVSIWAGEVEGRHWKEPPALRTLGRLRTSGPWQR